MRNIVKIRILKMHESCQRTTFFVDVITDEGFNMTVAGHATGSVYTNFEGLTIDQARDRALTDAHNWSDFLQIPLDPYVEDGVTYEPEHKFEFYHIRRELEAGRKKKDQVPIVP